MAHILQLPEHTDPRGSLCVLDKELPFSVKRSYWIFGNRNDIPRGGHRHHKTIQVLVAVAGSVTIFSDDGTRQENFLLNHPGKALLVAPKDWHIMHSFSPDCVLMVFASEPYCVEDYIDTPYREVPDFTRDRKETDETDAV